MLCRFVMAARLMPGLTAVPAHPCDRANEKRLSGADAFTLGMGTSRAYMHPFKVAIVAPSTDPDG